MAKQQSYRLPQPQKGLTSTYSAPNDVRPQAPQPINPPTAPDTSIPTALANLTTSLTQYGVNKQQEEMDTIAREETIKIDRMDIEEQRAYLAGLAREAEQSGALASGTNYFRIKFAQEHAAESIMRDQFAAALVEKTSFFTNPLNTEADPAKFAKDAFQNIPGIQGFYATSKSNELYETMTSNWLSQVRVQRAAKMEAKNNEDFANSYYMDANQLLTGEIDGDTYLQRRKERSDKVYEITGGSGQSFEIKAIQDLVTNRLNDPELDEDDITKLEEFLTKAETSTAEEGFGLGTPYGAEIDALQNLVLKREEELQEDLLENAQEDTLKMSMLAATHRSDILRGGGSLESDLFGTQAEALRAAAKAAGISNQVVEKWMMDNYLNEINSVQTQQARINPRDVEDVREQIVNKPIYEQITIIDASSLPQSKKDELKRNVYNMETLRQQTRNASRADVGEDINGLENALNALLSISSSVTGEDPEIINFTSDILSIISASSMNSIDQMTENGRTKEDKQTKIKETKRIIREVFDNETGLWDLEKAKEHDELFNEEALELMKETNQRIAGTRLQADTAALRDFETGQLQLSEEALDLEGGLNLFSRHMFSLVDDQIEYINDREQHGSVKATGLALREDAVKAVEEMATKPRAFTGNANAQIKSDGMYTQHHQRRGHNYSYDEEQTGYYLQAVRLAGLTVEEMESGEEKNGLKISEFPVLQNPALTLMVDPESFDAELDEFINANGADVDEEALLNNTELGKRYLAYTKMVENPVDIANWLQAQMEAPLQLVGRLFDPNDLKRLMESGDK
jgi:predicted site-specific integrase-resolvase